MTLATKIHRAVAKPICDHIMSKGLSLHQACGVLAQMQGESSFETNVQGDKAKDGKYHAFGLFQLHDDRIDIILNGYKNADGSHVKGAGIDMKTADAMSQVDGMWWELNHTERRALSQLISAKSAQQAGYLMCQYYERPARPDIDCPKRAQFAQDWYDEFKGDYA